MTGIVAVLLIGTLIVAIVNWGAVLLDLKGLEYAAKPMTMVMLMAAVAAMDVDDPAARWCFLVALAFSLLGDVFLMLPDEQRWFVFGLGAFLVGHLAYVPGLVLLGIDPYGVVIGVVALAVALGTLGRTTVAAVRTSAPDMAVPVIAYIGVISLMVLAAFSTGILIAIVGACLFYASDALIAQQRFVRPIPNGNVIVMVTYHLGQIGLALGLIA